jgi:hypothetical protein
MITDSIARWDREWRTTPELEKHSLSTLNIWKGGRDIGYRRQAGKQCRLSTAMGEERLWRS